MEKECGLAPRKDVGPGQVADGGGMDGGAHQFWTCPTGHGPALLAFLHRTTSGASVKYGVAWHRRCDGIDVRSEDAFILLQKINSRRCKL